MIAQISGKITGIGDGHVIIETAAGIGYKVHTTPSVCERGVGQATTLHTHLQVREDAMSLFGFETLGELAFFELLITVSGVGPKVALGILSSQNTSLIKDAIAGEDAALLTKIGGVGKKTAEKIILELRDKVAGGEGHGAHQSGDFLGALENLGYSSREIKDVVGQLDQSLPTEEKLRRALKLLGK